MVWPLAMLHLISIHSHFVCVGVDFLALCYVPIRQRLSFHCQMSTYTLSIVFVKKPHSHVIFFKLCEFVTIKSAHVNVVIYLHISLFNIVQMSKILLDASIDNLVGFKLNLHVFVKMISVTFSNIM